MVKEDEEKIDPKMTFNPALQYFAQMVVHKITNPEQAEVVPPMNQNIEEYVRPDREMFQEAEEEIAEFESKFDLQKVEEGDGEAKDKKRVYWKDIIAKEEEKVERMAEEAEAERLKFGGGKDDGEGDVKEISSVNPIADFSKMIKDRKVDRVGEAISQMQKMIERFIINSLKGDLFDKGIECIKELRKACVEEDEAPSFNRFAEQIKKKHGKGDDATTNFFFRMVKEKITLITKHESKLSSMIGQEEANEFLDVEIG